MDDLVQEVFVVVHAKLDKLEQPGSLRSRLPLHTAYSRLRMARQA